MKVNLKLLLILVTTCIFLIIPLNVSALKINSFNVTINLDETKVKSTYEISLTNLVDENFTLNLPRDAQIDSVLVNGFFSEFKLIKENLKKTALIPITNFTKEIKIRFSSSDYLDKGKKNYFTADINANYFINNFYATLILPENSILSKEGSNVFPEGTIGTDGRRIFISWTEKRLKVKDSFSIFVIYETFDKGNLLVYFLVLTLVLGISIFLYEFRKFRKLKEKEFSEKEKEKKEELEQDSSKHPVYSHLREEEQQIVNVLMQREGRIEQGTLVVITGFSKARLSRILAELDRRKIIHKEKRGKKNLIFLKES